MLVNEILQEVIGRNLVVHSSTEESCLLSKDHWVYRFIYKEKKLVPVCRIPVKDNSIKGRIKDWLARTDTFQLVFPTAGIGNLVELKSEGILIIYDRIYFFCPGLKKKTAIIIHSELVPKVAPPLRGGIAVHGVSQLVYFGEYLNGHSRDIRIVKIDTVQGKVQVCWQFKRSEIKHIHSVHYDHYRNRLWVCTGDTNSESAIYYTDDEFKSLNKFGGGDQRWRAIALLFSTDCIEWGMDAGQDAPAECINKIYRYQFSTNQLQEVATVGNPVYAACSFSDGTAVMATTFEPKRTQDTPPCAQIWYRDQTGFWSSIAEFPYRRSRRRGVSSYGMLYLPAGQVPKGYLLATPVNSMHYDYSALMMHLPATNV